MKRTLILSKNKVEIIRAGRLKEYSRPTRATIRRLRGVICHLKGRRFLGRDFNEYIEYYL